MDLKEHAQRLLKLAETIEKEAYENTFYICSHCNHTASLADINDRRVKFAAQEDPEITVKPVTINDTVVCPVPGCEGTMSYVATDSSENYYTEVKDSAEESDPAEDSMTEDAVKDEKKDKDEDKSDSKLDAEIDKLFEDVETQGEKLKENKKDKLDTIQKARVEKKQKEEETDLLGDPGKEKSEVPKDEDPLVDPEKKTEPEPLSVKEDDKPEPEKKEKPKKKKEPIDLDKKDVPKFKSKEANERYQRSCERYLG